MMHGGNLNFTHRHVYEIHSPGLRMEIFIRGLSSWTCSDGGRKSVRYMSLTEMKNTVTPHKHRHNQVNLSV
jgi:hypothetical protein